MGLNIDNILQPVSTESPCGASVESEAALFARFKEIEQGAQGTPERVVGESIIPAVEPNWSDVYHQATALLSDSKDVRVAYLLCRAALHRDGLSGLRDGLMLVSRLLSEFWVDLHPQLVDEDGDADPDYRVNAVAEFASDTFLKDLHVTPLVSSRAVGRFSFRDYRLATGELAPVGEESRPELAHVRAAFADVGSEDLQASRRLLEESMAAVEAIASLFNERLPQTSPPDLSKLARELQSILRLFDEQGGASESTEALEESVAPVGVGEPRVTMSSRPGEIRSREDVVRQIELICRYYEVHEPSSPVPLLLNRAKKLVAMDFMAIIRNMSPDSLHVIMNLAGIEEEES